MSEKIELKPCPFCGGEAQHIPPQYDEDNPSEIIAPDFVNCISCAVTIPGGFDGEAINAWNTRTGADQ